MLSQGVPDRSAGVLREVRASWNRSGGESRAYLRRVGRLRRERGPGFVIVLGWFISHRNPWIRVEPEVHALYRSLGSFEPERLRSASAARIVAILRQAGLARSLTARLQRFAGVVERAFGTWEAFGSAIRCGEIEEIFDGVFRGSGSGVTMKNLAAMAIHSGHRGRLAILDVHLARALGIPEDHLDRIRRSAGPFGEFIARCGRITRRLAGEYPGITTTDWSIAVWFARSGITVRDLDRRSALTEPGNGRREDSLLETP